MNPHIAWLKKDLRIEDNDVLRQAALSGAPVIPVYIKDPRDHSTTPQGWPRTDRHRAAFEHESVAAIARRLEAAGSCLLILEGKPEEILPELAGQVGATSMFHSQEAAAWERGRAARAVSALLAQGCRSHVCRPNTMFEPIRPESVGMVFTPFSRTIEATNPNGPSEPPPMRKPEPPPAGILTRAQENLRDWIAKSTTWSCDKRSSLSRVLNPGEAGGQLQRQQYLDGPAAEYHVARNGLHGADYSSKLSPWLAHGCISARTTGWMIKSAMREKKLPWEAGRKLLAELTWRDFFWHIALCHGSKIFKHRGIDPKSRRRPVRDPKKLERWCNGTTGDPLVNAFMRELAATGYMSNRGRQITASYLVNDLNQPWEDGAWWFQSQLIDFDPTQNWGNWLHASGNGTDPVPDRRFNPKTQADKFDPKGIFQALWR